MNFVLFYHSLSSDWNHGNAHFLRGIVSELLARGPVLAHCNSGNRTGAALIPYLMLDRGMREDDAVNEALRMGTRSAGLLDWGMEYARNQAG